MDIIRFSITNPVKVAVGVLLIVLFGAMALMAIPIQMTPDIDRPQISITTTWVGRSPEEIEKSILMEQEKKLKTLQGLYKMTSTASLGRAEVSLEFNVGYDITRALQEASNRLNEVPNYPDDVNRPIIRAASAQTDEAIGYALIYAEDTDFDVATFYDYADRYIKPALERIEGIAQIDIFGGRVHEVQVRFDPVTLAQNGITIEQCRAALTADNITDSAGDMTSSRQDIRFRVVGRFDSLEPIRETIITYAGGMPVLVKDVAEVVLVLRKKTGFNISRGTSNMSIVLRRDSGANVLAVMERVRATLTQLQEPGGLLRGYKNDRYRIRARMVYDDSFYIKAAIAVVQQNIYSGGALAILVLLLFLRSMRPTLIVAFTIPISIIGTFMVMYITGRNVNVISLTGLCFAVGMVVDNAIVVLENIDRHLHMGKPPGQAAYDGTREVWGAVLSSTLTTVAVFGPVLTIREESGQLFYDIALAICAAVLLSMFVSMTVIPTAATLLFRDKNNKKTAPRNLIWVSCFGLLPLIHAGERLFVAIIDTLTTQSFSGFVLRLAIVVSVSVVAVATSLALMPPASYLPTGNKNGLFANMLVPPSYSTRQNITIARRIEEQLRPYWEAKTVEEASALGEIVDTRNGQTLTRIPPISDFFFALRTQGIFMIATSKDPSLVRPLEVLFNNAMNTIPGCSGMARQQGLFGGRRSAGNAVQIEVVGNDMIRLRDATATLEARLVEEYSRAGVSSDPANYNISGPERQLVVDQVRAKELGLSVTSVATSARALLDGVFCGDFDFEGDNIDLVLIRDPDIPTHPDAVEMFPLAIRNNTASAATIVPLGQLVSFRKADASQTIRRVEQERAIQLLVNPPGDIALETAQRRIFDVVDECRRDGSLSSDIRINLAGSADKLSQTRAAMMGRWDGFSTASVLSLLTSRFFLSLVITYLLMAALFESFLYPLVIMFSVPFAMVGGFVGLAIVHRLVPTQQLDTLTMLGFIILIGIVVNNAILLIHQTRNLMQGISGESGECLGYRDAIREAVRTRLRPIFMTTLTSVCGMLPLVLAPGAGSELYKGLGGVVVGGLLCATLFTLLIIPLMFCLMIDLQNSVRWFLGRRVID